MNKYFWRTLQQQEVDFIQKNKAKLLLMKWGETKARLQKHLQILMLMRKQKL